MTICTDVYIRPQSCSVISIYPSQVHPFVPPPTPPVGGAGGPMGEAVVIRRHIDDDESILAALGLFGPRL